MARSKSRKIKRRKKQKHKRQKQGQKQLKSLKHKLKQGHFRGREIITNPSGDVKMSEVLMDFVAPYHELADTSEAYRKLLTLGITAWNASFLPKEAQQDMVDGIISGGIHSATYELQTGLKDIVNMLIARKEEYFSEYRRDIIDFELTDTGDGYHLSVASILEVTSQ